MSSSFGLGSSSSSAPAGFGQQQEQIVDTGTTSPWIAASDGNLELLRTSLARLSLPVTVADENGYTLLQAAASYGQIDVMKWILSETTSSCVDSITSSGAYINAVDGDGDTALHYASTADAAKLLCEFSGVAVDRSIRNHSGKTALEAKREELRELEDDDDYEEDDDEAVKLRAVISYLSSFGMMMQ